MLKVTWIFQLNYYQMSLRSYSFGASVADYRFEITLHINWPNEIVIDYECQSGFVNFDIMITVDYSDN